MIQSVLVGSSPVGQGTRRPLLPAALQVAPNEGQPSPVVVYLGVSKHAAFLGRLVSGTALYAWKEFTKYPAHKWHIVIMSIAKELDL